MTISRRGFFGFLGAAVATPVLPELGSKIAKVSTVKARSGPLATMFTGKTVGEIRNSLRDVLFIPKNALATLTRGAEFALPTTDDTILLDGDLVEFVRLASTREHDIRLWSRCKREHCAACKKCGKIEERTV